MEPQSDTSADNSLPTITTPEPVATEPVAQPVTQPAVEPVAQPMPQPTPEPVAAAMSIDQSEPVITLEQPAIVEEVKPKTNPVVTAAVVIITIAALVGLGVVVYTQFMVKPTPPSIRGTEQSQLTPESQAVEKIKGQSFTQDAATEVDKSIQDIDNDIKSLDSQKDLSDFDTNI